MASTSSPSCYTLARKEDVGEIFHNLFSVELSEDLSSKVDIYLDNNKLQLSEGHAINFNVGFVFFLSIFLLLFM